MRLTSEEVYELCQDFKDLVKGGDFTNLLPVDLKLLSIRDCVLFYKDTIREGIKINERGIGIPIIMYNVPSRTGMTIEVETIEKLMQNKMIYGLKESTADIQRIIHISTPCKDKISLYSGEDAVNYIFYTLGAQGTISVTANAYCQKVAKVYDL